MGLRLLDVAGSLLQSRADFERQLWAGRISLLVVGPSRARRRGWSGALCIAFYLWFCNELVAVGGVAGDICLCSKYVTVGVDILACDEPQRFVLHALEGIEVGFAGPWLPSCNLL